MDTKTQNLPITHTQPHSNARPQGHPCSQCNCSHHCQSCSWSCSQSPASHCSPAVPRSQSPSPSTPPRNHKHAMHPHHCRLRPTPHSSSCPRKRKTLEGKVNKRKAVKKSQRGHKATRRSSGTFQAEGEGTGPWARKGSPARPGDSGVRARPLRQGTEEAWQVMRDAGWTGSVNRLDGLAGWTDERLASGITGGWAHGGPNS
ncbi:Nuclear transition protein 2 [Galemys pyrenaicus]|uniref:Nuclear transition protein 2 n=1 Tax=Galemys pyrenaicus TaxID=202257 RepID=A0A8J6DM70_GALPY|nr:Nuclear transition protein 2 [Galemys pyrenaicus]